jgi:hypothetical protein
VGYLPSRNTWVRWALLTLSLSTQRNAKSPLLQLPAELRNQIYALALSHPMITICRYLSPISFRFCTTIQRIRRYPLNLLYVCRQIYSETAVLPYKLNSFDIYNEFNCKVLVEFLKERTTAQVEVMQRVLNSYNPEKMGGKSAKEWLAETAEEESEVDE